ncbi:PorH family porin [Corynebacterium phoceense]|uniref:PorH family porin n=1 Tax=Corynebacterium phoceense TaxID=1686286 RepID=UPI00211BA658|nr:PorH family porin [Corynebacterium phoceense]MCQ9331119.1 PorH family porin [Corynebacterium phoceense]MCQ9347516.1 PorH family porin [Corynebacterium phoceense]
MDLSFVTEQLDNFSTFGKAIYGLFTGFSDFAHNMNTMINGSEGLTEKTSGVFEGLSSKSEA